MEESDNKEEKREITPENITPEEYYDESKLTPEEQFRHKVMRRGTITVKPTLNLTKFLDGIFNVQKRSLKKESLYASAYTLSLLFHGIHYNIWYEKYKVMVPFWSKLITINNFFYIITTFLFRYYRLLKYFIYLKLGKIIEKPHVMHIYYLIRIAVKHWDKRLANWIFYYKKEMDARKKKRKNPDDIYDNEMIVDEEDYDIAWKYILTVNYYNGVNMVFDFRLRPPMVDFLDLVLIEFFREKVIFSYYDSDFFLCEPKVSNKFDSIVIPYNKYIIRFSLYKALLILPFLEYVRMVRYNRYIKAHDYLFNILPLRKTLLQFPFDKLSTILNRRPYSVMYFLKVRHALINGCFIFFSSMLSIPPKEIHMKEFYMNFAYASRANVFHFLQQMHGSRVQFVRHFFYDITSFWRLFSFFIVLRGPKRYYCENYLFKDYYSFWEIITRALPDHYKVLSHMINLLEKRVFFSINRQNLIKHYFVNDFKKYYEISTYYLRWKELLVFYRTAHLVVCVAIHRFILNFVWGQRFYRGWLPWNRLPLFLQDDFQELKEISYFKFNRIIFGFSDLIFTFNYFVWRAVEYKWSGSFFDNNMIDCMLYDRYELLWSSFKWLVEDFKIDPYLGKVPYQEMRPYSYTHLNVLVLTDFVLKMVRHDPKFSLLLYFFSIKGYSYVDLKFTDRDCIFKFVYDYGAWLRSKKFKVGKNFDITEENKWKVIWKN